MIQIGRGSAERVLASTEPSWIDAGPYGGPAFWPVVLNVAEGAAQRSRPSILHLLRQALAPTWLELQLSGLFAKVGIDQELPGRDELSTHEQAALVTAAQVIARMSEHAGVILRDPQRYDFGSLFFTERLLREAQLTGLHVVLDAPPAALRKTRLAPLLESASVNGFRGHRPTPTPNLRDEAVQFLALAPQGLALATLETLGIDTSRGSLAWSEFRGPDGTSWAFLPPGHRREVLGTLGESTKQALEASLYEAISPNGWGYLRRSMHAANSGRADLARAQHPAVLAGLQGVGLDSLAAYLGRVVALLEATPSNTEELYRAYVDAARIQPKSPRGRMLAKRWYRKALSLSTAPSDRASLIYEIANTYATERKPDSLRVARRWYAEGYRLLPGIADAEERAFAEIRLANGLALVEYHSGRNREALALEQRAREVCDEAAERFPAVAAWARPLLATNTAKLLARRFADLAGARGLLSENLARSVGYEEDRARLDLGKVSFDQGDYAAVVAVLSPLFERTDSTRLNEEQEMVGRFLLTLASSLLGMDAAASRQLSRLSYLATVLDSPGALSLIESVTQFSAPDSLSDERVRNRASRAHASNHAT
jgi:hypothetical protein